MRGKRWMALMEHWLIDRSRCEVTGSSSSAQTWKMCTDGLNPSKRCVVMRIWLLDFSFQSVIKGLAHPEGFILANEAGACGATWPAVTDEWVEAGEQEGSHYYTSSLPAAASHLLTTWTNWNKFSNKLIIAGAACTCLFILFLSRPSFGLLNLVVFFSSFKKTRSCLFCAKWGNSLNYIHYRDEPFV